MSRIDTFITKLFQMNRFYRITRKYSIQYVSLISNNRETNRLSDSRCPQNTHTEKEWSSAEVRNLSCVKDPFDILVKSTEPFSEKKYLNAQN